VLQCVAVFTLCCSVSVLQRVVCLSLTSRRATYLLLQCVEFVAVYCSVLQCQCVAVSVCCSVSVLHQCVAVCCRYANLISLRNILHSHLFVVVVCCSVFQFAAVCYSVLQCLRCVAVSVYCSVL